MEEKKQVIGQHSVSGSKTISQHSNTATQQTKQGIEKLSSNTTTENQRTDLKET